MIKVGFVSFDFPDYCLRLVDALSRDANVLFLMARRGRMPRRLPGLALLAESRCFEKPRYRQAARNVRLVLEMVRQLRRFDPDVVHLQQGHLWFNLALPLLRRYPLVVTAHDPRHHYGDRESQKVPQWLIRFGFDQARRIIVHGENAKQTLARACGVSPEIIHVIPHVALAVAGRHAPVRENGHTILFFGRIWPYKGLDYLIRAEPLITRELPGAKIVIAGQGEDFRRYREMMVHPENFIVHNEFVSDQRRAELFQRASLVVLPYVDASQSGVIPLAYAASKAVVATAVGCLPEIVDHEETGLLIPARNENALAEAVVRLLRDPSLRHRLGANGKRKLDSECGPDVVARQTMKVYELATRTS